MSTNRVAAVEKRLSEWLASAQPPERRLGPEEPLSPGSRLTARVALELFEAQVKSRALDQTARELKRDQQSFYTISSAGHEQNAILGWLLRLTDPCFLHYRSGAFMMARQERSPGSSPIFDTLLSLCASSDDPVSGGRHKVWGSRDLWVPPQTSTIASHLPKAVGAAFALSRARHLGLPTGIPQDAIVCCSFGDASTHHATALAGVASARYGQRRGTPMPILFVCEDNGIGISVDTPRRWVHDTYSRFQHLTYFEADGEIDEVFDICRAAIDTCRSTRSPVFLHLHTIRLWGHAGSDVETSYHTLAEIEANESHDPLLANARRLVQTGAADGEMLAAIWRDARERVTASAREAVRRPHLRTREEVVAPLALADDERLRTECERPIDSARRQEVWGERPPEKRTSATLRTLAAHINAALTDEMLRHPEMLVFGEDVGKKGGVYGVTRGLQERFGTPRVFDTLLDETTILGVAQGAAHFGFLSVPEIQYLAYIHNALDQLRGEACSLSYFSNGQFTNPMVVRVASFAYQRGFGGHFHNDNSIGALRDIPGLVLAAPSRGDDAARMLRGVLAMAKANGRVACFLEPIALYHERDLYEDGDELWLSDYPKPDSHLLPGEVGVYDSSSTADPDLVIATYANGVRLSLRAARRLEREGVRVRVLDLRWLAPLPHGEIERHARECGALLCVDECRASGGGVADAIIAALTESGFRGWMGSVRAADSYIPLGPSTDAVLVTEEQIVQAARGMV